MSKVILPLFYFPNIQWFSEFLNSENHVVLEGYEIFPKQTYRNRCEIAAANGKLKLMIPIQKSSDRIYKNVKISFAEDWRKIHWRSIKTAYKNSPYFYFYEPRFEKLYTSDIQSIFEFNVKALQLILKILKSEKEFFFTENYQHEVEGRDLRKEFSTKKGNSGNLPEYYQVFSEKLGFIPNLSILDLIFNLGPEANVYLKKLTE